MIPVGRSMGEHLRDQGFSEKDIQLFFRSQIREYDSLAEFVNDLKMYQTDEDLLAFVKEVVHVS